MTEQQAAPHVPRPLPPIWEAVRIRLREELAAIDRSAQARAGARGMIPARKTRWLDWGIFAAGVLAYSYLICYFAAWLAQP